MNGLVLLSCSECAALHVSWEFGLCWAVPRVCVKKVFHLAVMLFAKYSITEVVDLCSFFFSEEERSCSPFNFPSTGRAIACPAVNVSPLVGSWLPVLQDQRSQPLD